MEFKNKVIKVSLQHSDIRDRVWPEIRVDNCSTVASLKEKLYSHCGTPPWSMALYAYDPCNVVHSQVLLDKDSYQLHMYGISDGYVIYIKDLNQKVDGADVAVKSQFTSLREKLADCPLKDTNSRLHQHYMEQLENCEAANDESAFQRYRISDEEYEKRGAGLRNFIAQMRQKTQAAATAQGTQQEPEGKSLEELKRLYPIDARCCVMGPDIRGTVKFVGMVNNIPSIGIDLDEPLGTCDGSLGAVRYFTAKGSKYGAFYPYGQVLVGDYPELDPFDID